MSTAPTAATAATYTIDPAHSGAGFKIRHLMIAYIRGGFSGVTGDVVFDPANPANSKVNATIDANSLLTHDVKRDAHVKGADFLDTANHPTITFVSKSVVADGKNQWKVQGDLTLRGVTKPLELTGELAENGEDPWGNQRIGLELSATIDRRDFGLDWNQTLPNGNLLVANEVKLLVSVSAVKTA